MRRKVILRTNLLEKRSFNITTEFNSIIQIFQDCKLVQDLKVEIEKVVSFQLI
jgi:hypothetical protein